jgi:hypothetical protein
MIFLISFFSFVVVFFPFFPVHCAVNRDASRNPENLNLASSDPQFRYHVYQPSSNHFV